MTTEPAASRERIAKLLYDAHYGHPGSSLAWSWEKTSMESRETHREMADAVLPLLADARAQTVEAWVERIVSLWPMDSTNYPELDGTRGAYVRHVILHMAKDAGRLAGAIERTEHGRTEDGATLIRSTRNMLVNAFRLCALLMLKPDALLADYEQEIRALLPPRPAPTETSHAPEP